jgi:hypothetical protein
VFGLAWTPNFDLAVVETAVRDVGHRTPLLGPYSRYGWFHPGPLMYLVLAVPYRLLGGDADGLLVGHLLVQFGALFAIVAIAYRRGGLTLMVLAFVTGGLLLRAMNAGTALTPTDPWGPYITVLPFLLLVLVAWAASCGDELWALPLAAVVASFVVQTHVSYAAEAVALLVWTLVWWVHRFRSARREGSARRSYVVSIAVSAGLLVLLWIAPIWEEITRHPGNLTLIARYVRSPGESRAGLGTGGRVLAAELNAWAPWMGARERVTGVLFHSDPVGPFIPVALVVLAAGAYVAWRRHATDRLKLCALVAVLLPVAWISMADVSGPMYQYLTRMTWVVGAACWLAGVWGILAIVGSDAPAALVRLGRAAGVVAVVAVGVALTVTMSTTAPSSLSDSNAVRGISKALVRWDRHAVRGQHLYLRYPGLFGPGDGVVNQLVRAGVPVLVTGSPKNRFGESREYSGQPSVPLFLASGDGASGRALIGQLATTPGLQLVARYHSKSGGGGFHELAVFRMATVNTPIPA